MAEISRNGAEDVRQHLLVLRCQAGDENAFTELYTTFGDRSRRYLRGLLGDNDADDVHQEVWLSVYRRVGELADPGGFRTWLFATTRNRAIDYLRKRKRDAQLLETGGAAEFATANDEPASLDEWDPSWVRETLAQLPTVQREAVMLRYWDDLSYAEIAVIVGCSIGTVRSRLHNAKRALRIAHSRDHVSGSTQVDDTKERP